MKTMDEKIKELSFAGRGESYGTGYRNPVRDDTQHLLTTVTAVHRPQRMLELGTAFGLSGLCLLRGAPKAELITVEFDKDAADKARDNFAEVGFDSVVVINDDAGKAIDGLSGRFDLVFIDHNKGSYFDHFELMRKKGLIATRTVVLADNTIDRREECQQYLTHVGNFHTIEIPTECGLTITVL